MITIDGPYGIRATILADSVSAITGDRFTTYEIEYPRIILAELNTHRGLSKNSASSRAIPFKKMLEQLIARPVRFGQANAGMQDKGDAFEAPIGAGYTPEQWWDLAKLSATRFATEMFDAGYHKQIYNRLVEPFQMMKTVISGTEWPNFFWLRDHEAADPTIAALARVMAQAREESTPFALQPGQWHLPYVDWLIDPSGTLRWKDEFGTYMPISIEDAIKISCARCAAVSFRNVDYGLVKSREVYDRLVGDARKHASAFEHCATPMADAFVGQDDYDTIDCINLPEVPDTWQAGISHMDREGALWSGNLRGFIQYRKLIDGENYTGR